MMNDRQLPCNLLFIGLLPRGLRFATRQLLVLFVFGIVAIQAIPSGFQRSPAGSTDSHLSAIYASLCMPSDVAVEEVSAPTAETSRNLARSSAGGSTATIDCDSLVGVALREQHLRGDRHGGMTTLQNMQVRLQI